MSTCYSPFTNTTDGVCRRFESAGHQNMFKTYGLDVAQLHWDFFFVDMNDRLLFTCMFTHSSSTLSSAPGHFASHWGSVWSVVPCQCGQWPYQRCVLFCSVGVAQRQKQLAQMIEWNWSMRRFIRTAKEGFRKTKAVRYYLSSSKCHERRCQQN